MSLPLILGLSAPACIFIGSKLLKQPSKKVMMRRARSLIVSRERLGNMELSEEDPLPGGTPKNAVRCAIVGTGWGLRVQLPKFRQEGIHVVGIYSRDPKKAEKIALEQSVPMAFTSIEDLASCPHVDLVSIVSPPFLHKEHTIAALRAGKHVICDKPTCLNAQEAEEMVRVYEEMRAQDRRLASARASAGWNSPFLTNSSVKTHNASSGPLVALLDHELRFTPAWQAARGHIRHGRIGEVLYVDVHIFQPPAKTVYSWWAQEEKGGGVLGAIGSHMLDSLRFLLDASLEEVACTLTSIVKELPEEADPKTMRKVTSDDYCSMGLKLRVPLRGAASPNPDALPHRTIDARVTVAFAGAESTIKVKGMRNLIFTGTKGSLVLDIFDASMVLYDAQGNVAEEIIGRGNAFAQEGTPQMAKAIRAALSTTNPQKRALALEAGATLWDGLQVQYGLDAARESARNGGKWTKIKQIEDFKAQLEAEEADALLRSRETSEAPPSSSDPDLLGTAFQQQQRQHQNQDRGDAEA